MIFNGKRYNGLLFYKKKGENEYILVDHNKVFSDSFGSLCFECVAPVGEGLSLGVCTSSVSVSVLAFDYYYIVTTKVPLSWINAFRPYIEE